MAVVAVVHHAASPARRVGEEHMLLAIGVQALDCLADCQLWGRVLIDREGVAVPSEWAAAGGWRWVRR